MLSLWQFSFHRFRVVANTVINYEQESVGGLKREKKMWIMVSSRVEEWIY